MGQNEQEITQSPAHEAYFNLHSRVAFDVWPKDAFNKIEGVERCKQFYNSAYNALLDQLNSTLDQYHPAAWVRIGYLQLELWTVVLSNHEKRTEIANVTGPGLLAPIGRYGWRYVIEKSLEKLPAAAGATSDRPSDHDVNKVFTLLVALSYSSEYSNYLHHFGDRLSSATVTLSPYVFLKGLEFDGQDRRFYQGIIDYMGRTPDWTQYRSFAVEQDELLLPMINNMLEACFGFDITDVKKITEAFLNTLSPLLGASVLITTYGEAVNLLSGCANLPPATVQAVLNFLLLDVRSDTYTTRDFLSRSQPERMLNYAGVIIHLAENLESIYDAKAAGFEFVRSADTHIILTGTLLAEWMDIFISRLVFGQRQDLKNASDDLKHRISEIESRFHKHLFEGQLRALVSSCGYQCMSVDKVDGRPIPCGEIDLLAYNPASGVLLIVEAKYTAPAKDARSMGKVLSDHFKQKKYHQKFIRKINWAAGNLATIRDLFKKQFNIDMDPSVSLRKCFVTGSANAVKFLVSEYEVCTFYEVEALL